LYDTEGRLRGAYIYMLLCRDDDGPVYVKIGMTEHPDQRLSALRTGCPVTPHQFCTIRRSSRARAYRTEAGLHSALNRWKSSGEWYRVPVSEKDEFNAVLREALASHSQRGYSNTWERVPVQPLIRLAKKRCAAYLKKRNTSRAYLDFKRHDRKGLHSS
jgi:hypothetical protein